MNCKFLIAGALVLSSFSAFAGSSAQLNMNGTVALVNELSVAQDASALNLSITSGTNDLKIGTATEISNDKNGYDIMMSSLNAGKLVHTEEPSMYTGYTLSYNNLPAVTPGSTPEVVKTVASLSGLQTLTSDIKVNVVAHPMAAAGDYRDTLMFSIVAK